MTSKLQVTVPRLIASKFAIRPGDEIDWIPAGDFIRVVMRAPPKRQDGDLRAARLKQFDQATARLKQRKSKAPLAASVGSDRGWTREDLYRRGRSH